MDSTNQNRKALIRTLVAGALIFALLHLARTTDVLSWLTRPAAAAVLKIFGGVVSDRGNHLVIGQLWVPWTRDCAGFDVLLVLWGLILWTSRHDPVSRRFWLRLAAAVPAAVLANIARVLTIVAWRKAFFPAVESPQMHYFMGFLWLLPLLAFFVPRGNRSILQYAVETGVLASALSLTAPQASAPGGGWVTACTLLMLAGQRWHSQTGKREVILGIAWFTAAIGIAGAGMESLWLPWLLLCPWCTPHQGWLSPRWLLVPCTIPVVAMKAPWLAAIAIVWGGWQMLKSIPEPTTPRLSWITQLALLLILPLPFVASTLGPVLRTAVLPPPGVMAQPIESGQYRLCLVGQSPDVVVSWNAPSGTGRHHTLPVCLKYRGRTLQPEPSCPTVQKDSQFWFAEAFLMPEGELLAYDGYLRSTLMPFSPAGVHLIASAPKGSMKPAEFEATARRLFAEIARLDRLRAAAPTAPRMLE
jgi:exosortase/archaeosortase family protein